MRLNAATSQEIACIAACLTEAFETEPATTYLFSEAASPKSQILLEMSELIARAKLAMGMPLLTVASDGHIFGALAGQDASGKDWPADLEDEWQHFEARHKGVGERFRRFEAITSAFKPEQPHYKINMVGVAAPSQRQGIGRLLVQHCCGLSDDDPSSSGVLLETATASNIEYYQKLGFRVLGSGELDSSTELTCMYRIKP